VTLCRTRESATCIPGNMNHMTMVLKTTFSFTMQLEVSWLDRYQPDIIWLVLSMGKLYNVYAMHIQLYDLLCRIYTRTHVARKHVSRTSNLYRDTYMLMYTVARYKLLVRDTCGLYLGDIITIHLCHSRLVSLCIQQQTGDKLATVLSPIQETCWRRQVDTSGYNLYPATCILV